MREAMNASSVATLLAGAIMCKINSFYIFDTTVKVQKFCKEKKECKNSWRFSIIISLFSPGIPAIILLEMAQKKARRFCMTIQLSKFPSLAIQKVFIFFRFQVASGIIVQEPESYAL